MFARMLLVWLLVMNLGVLAWWALHRPSPAAPVATDSRLPSLQLLGEEAAPATGDATSVEPVSGAPASTASEPAPAAPESTAAADPAREIVEPALASVAPVCASYGPFADEAAALAAGRRLAGVESALRRVAATSPRGWSVALPPLENREAAVEMAERLRAAGFNDLMVVNQGENANGIALGRFGSEDNARRHQSALQAKGFAAVLVPAGPVGEGVWWLDVRAPAGFDAAARRAAIGAARVQRRDC